MSHSILQKIYLLLIKIFKIIVNIIYSVFKLCIRQIENRVLFISRQSNELTVDFHFVIEKIKNEYPSVDIKIICRRFDDSGSNKLSFVGDMIKSMALLASSKVCVIDAYIPTVSILRHRSNLTVIQMWHALGKIKQSGYQTLDKDGGRSASVAKALNMHKNYDYVIAGGKAWNEYYCKSFNIDEAQILNFGLPRIDYMIENKRENEEKFYSLYPEYKNCDVVLYAPTFRRGNEFNYESLIKYCKDQNITLIVKEHPNQQSVHDEYVETCSKASTVQVLAACEYLITDYSAIAIEGAILNKKTLYFLPDYEEYIRTNGLNVDPMISMPSSSFKNAEDVIDIILNNKYNIEEFKNYKRKYLPEELGTSTEKIARLILSKLG